MSDKKTYTQEELDAALEKATAGLKAKNEELLGEAKAAKKAAKDLEARISSLESAAEEAEQIKATKDGDVAKAVQAAEAKAAKQIKKLEGDLETANAQLRRAVVDQGLTEALTKAKVAGPYLDAARALIGSKHKIEIRAGEDGSITPVVGDKPLAEFVESWAQGADGKHFITAPGSSGAGASGASPGAGGTGKTKTRAEFESMSHAERAAFSKEGGTLIE